MNVLGISCYFHDAAAALVVDGRVVAAAEEERFTRRKHDHGFPERSIAYCLEAARIGVADIDGIAFYEKPVAKLRRAVRAALDYPPEDMDGLAARLVRLRHQGLSIEDRVRQSLGYTGPMWYVEHHVSHGASAFFCSPFDRAAILTVDGVGEHATTTIATARNHDYRIVREITYPHSLGLFYSAITAFLGFEVNNDEYKVMGLAAYGQPTRMREMETLLELRDDGSFALNLDYFRFHTNETVMCSPKMVDLLGAPHPPDRPAGIRERDIAASAQLRLEQAMTGLVGAARAATGDDHLCLAGGVALNGVANWRAFRRSAFRRLFVQPAAGDSGGAIGAALYAYHQQPGAVLVHGQPFSPCQGPVFGDADVERALQAHGLSYRKLDDATFMTSVADSIASDQIVGWFQGRMELGPRALGCRSILGNPANAAMKDHINACVKFREEFRPFAPAILAERAEEFFELNGCEAPYMVLVPDARPGVAARIPAVVHVDNTGRVQTVSKQLNPRFHALLEALDARTGIPVVLNTSFNVKGEPIVCTPGDAVRCFLNTDIDVLAINNYVVEKSC